MSFHKYIHPWNHLFNQVQNISITQRLPHGVNLPRSNFWKQRFRWTVMLLGCSFLAYCFENIPYILCDVLPPSKNLSDENRPFQKMCLIILYRKGGTGTHGMGSAVEMLKWNTHQVNSVKLLYYKLFFKVIDEMMSVVPTDTSQRRSPDMDTGGRRLQVSWEGSDGVISRGSCIPETWECGCRNTGEQHRGFMHVPSTGLLSLMLLWPLSDPVHCIHAAEHNSQEGLWAVAQNCTYCK